MSNFRIEFLNSPWWLLLLIPAFALTLIPHFLIAKKYRRNRNRICSLVLHLVIMVLTITTLSGMYFTYDLPNTSNEVIILVDMSFSGEENQTAKKEYVKSVIEESDSLYRVGVVTFGYDQVYAAPFSTDIEEVCNNFDAAVLPDTDGTDIASALNFARSLFTSKENGKILLVSDGAQTDGDAYSAVRSLVANGIQVNTTFFPSKYDENEMQIVDVVLPDYNVSLNEDFIVSVTIESRLDTPQNVELSLYDSNEDGDNHLIHSEEITVNSGTQSFNTLCNFSVSGMHQLHYNIKNGDDDLNENNDYYSYVYIENFNNILIIERDDGESKILADVLTKNDYSVKAVNIANKDELPQSVDELRNYDEVVLMNIANRDMPDGFIEMLYSYVNDYGGGLFTTGGNIKNEYGNIVANAYDRQDMANTLYQEMLPVQVIDYTPPLGVMIIIDRSGSMSSPVGSTTRLEEAKRGAIASLYALSERDYCGIMTLDTEFNIEQSIISATNQTRLIRTINNIEIGGGTVYSGAIRRAGLALSGLRNVEKRHVILISDGQPGEDYEMYAQAIRDNLKSGITFSMVAIGVDKNSEYEINMRNAAQEGNGRYYGVIDETLADVMSEELSLDEITAINDEPFQPKIRDHTNVVSGIEQNDIPMLGGYYGTKLKEDNSVIVPLTGEFVPIYAQWRLGVGKVGSFMCDLNGNDWSKSFMDDDVGQKLLCNIVKSVLPTSNIRANEIKAQFVEDNFSTHVSIYTDLKENERMELTVSTIAKANEEAEVVQKITPTADEGYSRMNFVIRNPGVYEVSIVKLDALNNVIAELKTYRTFSYSKEFDRFVNEDDCELLMRNVAEYGRGEVISAESPWQIYNDMEAVLHNTYDPRWLFIITALILFLLDIAVRKFKFKWLHEIIREHRVAKKYSEHAVNSFEE